jgi:PST family polysaccharide transporter
MTFFFILAPELILMIYGPKWSIVANIVRILCLCGMMQSVGTIAGLIYQSVGKTYLQLRMGILNTIVIFLGLIFAVHYGLFGVTIGYAAISVLWVHVSLGVVSRVIGMRYATMYSSLGAAYLISAVLLIASLTFKHFIVASNLFVIISVSTAFLLLFAAMLFVTGELKFENKRFKFAVLN